MGEGALHASKSPSPLPCPMFSPGATCFPFRPRAFAIRDFYPFWKSRNERSHAGKLLFLDPDDKETLQIFFDDNIGHTAAHIIDARNLHTGEPLPFKVSSAPLLRSGKSLSACAAYKGRHQYSVLVR